ncbi:hypothetical protein Tco_0874128 [Tanacetum coccineum]|uniref:Uncharacterized protein n=1 Tax=Tanacetum coccineum TaxID=301880 RepID=A0ABQ5BNK0_9ASTR
MLQTMNMSLMDAKEMVLFGRKKSDFWVGDGDFQDIHGVGYEDNFVITPLGTKASSVKDRGSWEIHADDIGKACQTCPGIKAGTPQQGPKVGTTEVFLTDCGDVKNTKRVTTDGEYWVATSVLDSLQGIRVNESVTERKRFVKYFPAVICDLSAHLSIAHRVTKGGLIEERKRFVKYFPAVLCDLSAHLSIAHRVTKGGLIELKAIKYKGYPQRINIFSLEVNILA